MKLLPKYEPWHTFAEIGYLLALAMTIVWLWNREHRLRGEAERRAEAAELTLKGQIVETESTRRQLQGSLDELLQKNATLAAAVDQARTASPGAKPVSIHRLDTGALKVEDTPSPTPAGTAATEAPTPHPPESGLSSVCSLHPGDDVSIDVQIAELQTKLQNVVIVGTADVWRETPPRAHLAGGRFQSYLSSSRKEQVVSPPRWGAQIIAGTPASAPGALVWGGGVLAPPLEFLGLRLEPSAAVIRGADILIIGSLGVRL